MQACLAAVRGFTNSRYITFLLFTLQHYSLCNCISVKNKKKKLVLNEKSYDECHILQYFFQAGKILSVCKNECAKSTKPTTIKVGEAWTKEEAHSVWEQIQFTAQIQFSFNFFKD